MPLSVAWDEAGGPGIQTLLVARKANWPHYQISQVSSVVYTERSVRRNTMTKVMLRSTDNMDAMLHTQRVNPIFTETLQILQLGCSAV
jgi:hypothetical protein